MKGFFCALIARIKSSVTRFFPSFCLTLIMFGLTAYMTIWEPDGKVSDILLQVFMTASFSFLLSVLCRLLLERYSPRLPALNAKARLTEAGVIALSALMYPALSGYKDNPYIPMRYAGVMVALFACVVYFADNRDISVTFSHLLKSTVFNGVVCGIITAGTMISIFAFHSLIYSFPREYKAYGVDALFIWIVLFLNLSLSIVPGDEDELPIPKLFRTIIGIVGLPVYLILIFILYIYLGKILFTWSFPSGRINWFASVASLFYVFFIFTLRQYRGENRFFHMYVRYGGFLIIPIILTQFIAIYIRFSNYGLTVARYISIALNLVALSFAVLASVRGGRHIKLIITVLIAVALLLTLTPLNAIDTPAREQSARLLSALKRNDMLNGYHILANAGVSTEDKIIITSAYDYIRRSKVDEDKLPAALAGFRGWVFADKFGFAKEYEKGSSYNELPRTYYSSYSYDYRYVDISEYSGYYDITPYSVRGKVIIPGYDTGVPIFEYDITDTARALYNKDGAVTFKNTPLVIDVDNYRLCITELRFSIQSDNGALNVSVFNGFLLTR